jgi:hypothetical protein
MIARLRVGYLDSTTTASARMRQDNPGRRLGELLAEWLSVLIEVGR